MSASAYVWIIETLAASALLIGLVLILRRPVARLFGPHAAYLLWSVPALRLLLPPLPGLTIVDLPAAAAASLATPQTTFAGSAGLARIELSGLPSVASGLSFDWGLAVTILWLSAAAIHMLWHVGSYRRFIARAVGSQASVSTIGGIRVYAADVAGPAAAGIVRRRIFLPYDFADRFDEDERRLALAHEVAHHRRGDLAANWLALAILSLHWFNPLAHIAYRAFRADQELACDASVLGAASASERHAYASAVVKAAWVKSPVAACPMNSAAQLKARLSMMMRARAWSVSRRLTGFVMVSLIGWIALAATASSTVAAHPEPGQIFRSPVAETVPAVTQTIRREIDPSEAAVPTEATVLTEGPTAALDRVVEQTDAREAMEAPAPQIAALAVTEDATPMAVIPAAAAQAGDGQRPSAIVHAVAETSASPAVFPSPKALRTSAAEAQRLLRSMPSTTVYRNVRAVMVDGQFNTLERGQAYVGFCGELRITASGPGYKETGWLPFFVSATPSLASGAAAKCAGPRSPENLTAVFFNASNRRNRPAGRNACTANQFSCTPPYYSRIAATNPEYPTSLDFGIRDGAVPR